ncbi:hypothetical protein [Pseudomonas palmensis]|uniref:hypothetical protein n=1 Tax=Pseudomonas palmensis TaxID=2815362 RepID=UPI001AE4696A|nr:hypothetical protein [Pseudomonas palmensis]
MFGLTVEEWGVINGFANWLAAIGTISAVIVSLYLSTKGGKRNANLSVNLMLMAEQGSDHHPEHIVYKLVNTGDRSFHPDSIGWVFGKKKDRSSFIQLFDRQLSNDLPTLQASGVANKWLFSVDDQRWFTKMAESLGADWKRNIKTLRALATTTTGEEFLCIPGDTILTKIKEQCLAIQQAAITRPSSEPR